MSPWRGRNGKDLSPWTGFFRLVRDEKLPFLREIETMSHYGFEARKLFETNRIQPCAKVFWNKGMWSNYPAKKVGCEHNHLRLLHPLKKILSCLTMNNSFLFRTRQVLLTSRRSLPCTLFCLLICLKFITTLGKTFRSPPTNYSISGART